MATKKKTESVQLSLEELAAEVNQRLGMDVVVKGSDASITIHRLTSGILSLDLALGGGWATNQWNEIVGPESSGKTALVYKTIAENQAKNPDFVAMFVAAEEFVPEYARSFGVDTDRLWVVESNRMETVFDLVVKAAENRVVDLIAIDSLPALETESEHDKDLVDGLVVSPGARIISTFFKKMGAAGRRSLTDPTDRPCTYLLVNQWRDQIGVMFGDPRITPGGKAKNYYFFIRLEVSRDEWLQTGSDLSTRVGQTIAMKTIKNKTYRPQQRAQADFYFADAPGFKKGQFDTVKDVVNVALALDLFEGRYKFNGERIATKKEELYQVVREQPQLYEQLCEAAHIAMFPHLHGQTGKDPLDASSAPEGEVADVVEAGVV